MQRGSQREPGEVTVPNAAVRTSETSRRDGWGQLSASAVGAGEDREADGAERLRAEQSRALAQQQGTARDGRTGRSV